MFHNLYKINGLVCPSCAIGIKNGLNKTKLVKQIKFDTKKQLCFVEYISIEILEKFDFKKL